MTSLLQGYKALTPSTPSIEKLSAIKAISNALPFSIDTTTRENLVTELLKDLGTKEGSRLSDAEILPALVALKTLGRDKQASYIIIEPKNLEILHSYARSQDTEASKESLRCVANALLLHAEGSGEARTSWISVGGAGTCVDILKRESLPDYAFLASRILFLVTLKPSDFLERAVESLGLVEIIAERLDTLLLASQKGQPMAKDALTDILKLLFNLLVHYPRMVNEKADSSNRVENPVIGDLWDTRLVPLLAPLLRLFNSLPQTSSAPLVSPLTHVIHALINIPVAPYAKTWFNTPSKPGGTADTKGKSSVTFDTVQRAYDLLDLTLKHYVPNDPDDSSVQDLCTQEGINLDETAPPLVLLLRRMVMDNEEARKRVRQWLLPPDLDRSSPLEKRSDILGRCLRMLASVYHTRLKDSIGELLFAVCNSDANTMAAQIGYGNAAGFLFNKGIMAPPATSASISEDVPENFEELNPITGTSRQTEDPSAILASMSDEEKEREAEKLFVLFDRLEKLGMVVNPVRKAQQE
ncbi:hypothetical protein FRC03_004245 [Tulasnella sp. 419]|nr:hypothetical protein FRC03_004245 [Tulasnella sp. 419]